MDLATPEVQKVQADQAILAVLILSTQILMVLVLEVRTLAVLVLMTQILAVLMIKMRGKHLRRKYLRMKYLQTRRWFIQCIRSSKVIRNNRGCRSFDSPCSTSIIK